MKHSKIFAAIIAALFLVASAYSAAYLKFDGVDGESKDKDHKGWIDILSVSGLQADSSGAKQGKGTIIVTKHIDKSTPKLAEARWKSNAAQARNKVVLSHNGKRYVLTNVMVTSVKVDGKKETLKLSYGSMRAQHDTAMAVIRNMGAKEAKPAAPANHNTTRSNKTAE